MSYKEIILEKSDQIATIILNRPERLNAFTQVMHEEIRDAHMVVENDPTVRVTIITGSGRGFCAGADLERGGKTFDGSGRPSSTERERPASFLKFCFSLKKPVIVAYNGPSVGVGMSMTLPYDIRIAAESSRLGFIFNRRGVAPELACPWLLPRIVGISRAAELMLTGRILTAKEALEFGIVSRVVPNNELISAAHALAQEIINCAPASVALTRYMLYQFIVENDYEKAERINGQYFAWTGKQLDAREGVMAFLEKRDPKWNLKLPGDMPDFFPLE